MNTHHDILEAARNGEVGKAANCGYYGARPQTILSLISRGLNETERLAEVAALHHERKRKAEELAAIDRQIDLILFPQSAGGRKQSTRSGKDWERILRCGDECSQKGRRALAG